MDAIFEYYPGFAKSKSLSAPRCQPIAHFIMAFMGAGANMTSGFHRSMACAFMPDSIFLMAFKIFYPMAGNQIDDRGSIERSRAKTIDIF
jgi:hypothetical protein